MKYQSLENLPFKGLLLLLSFLSITVANVQAADNGCQVLQDKVHGWSVRASAPGNYCLAADLKQTETPAMLRLPHQPGPVDPLLTIASANVAVDLGQHALLGKRSSGLGLWLNGGRDMRYFPAHVRNGTIRTEEQPAVFMVYAWNRRNKRF